MTLCTVDMKSEPPMRSITLMKKHILSSGFRVLVDPLFSRVGMASRSSMRLLRNRLLGAFLPQGNSTVVTVQSARTFSSVPEDASEVESDLEEVKDSSEVKTTRLPTTEARFQGIYKAVLVGEVGFGPVEKVLNDGRTITLFSVGTSGLITSKARNDELQWHKVGVYPDRLRDVAKRVKKGGRVYLEGNLESRLFNDITTGYLRRSTEVAIRHDGQLVLLEDKAVARNSKPAETKPKTAATKPKDAATKPKDAATKPKAAATKPKAAATKPKTATTKPKAAADPPEQ